LNPTWNNKNITSLAALALALGIVWVITRYLTPELKSADPSDMMIGVEKIIILYIIGTYVGDTIVRFFRLITDENSAIEFIGKREIFFLFLYFGTSALLLKGLLVIFNLSILQVLTS
jgi:hypothetical protein